MAVAWVAFVIAVLSSAYQAVQAKKMKDKAKRAAEARKGFEVPTEGQPSYIPVVYGRAKIGGVRSFHATNGNFNYVATNGDRTFLAGASADFVNTKYFIPWSATAPSGWTGPVAVGTIGDYLGQWLTGNLGMTNSTQVIHVTTSYGGTTNRLVYSQTGHTNAYMYFQQVLCQAPINHVYDIVFDESRFLDDPAMGTDYYMSGVPRTEAAFRADVHYAGGLPDSVAMANCGERRNALYQDMAYASMVAKLDRENPQFSGTPEVQFLLEGRLIKSVTGGVLASTKTYSNNPALCLLDYLTDTVAGKGVPESEINLPTFETGAAICGTIVQSGVLCSGKIYRPTDGASGAAGVTVSNGVLRRDLPLYECNIVLDPAKTIRENVEAILFTMGDARLVWSQGMYSLNMQYPATNDDIVTVLTIDDDNIVIDQEVSLSFPNSSDKYNFATVRFHNEAENFKEDSVSWPIKLGPNPETKTVLIPTGGVNYPSGVATSGWDAGYASGTLLNNYSVWNTNDYTVHLPYLFVIDKDLIAMVGDTTFTIEFSADDSGSFEIYDYTPGVGPAGTAFKTGSTTSHKQKHSSTVTLGNASADKAYKIVLNCTDQSGQASTDEGSRAKGRGVAARILHGNMVVWSSRDPAYQDVMEKTYDNSAYLAMLTEDNGFQLEIEVFADGITDSYHALAKAEELVRSSRSGLNVRLKFRIGSHASTPGQVVIPEPGDFVKVQSTTLSLGDVTPLYFRVNSIKLDVDMVASVEMNRFDASFLAWNVKDDEIQTPAPAFVGQLKAPLYVWWDANTGNLFEGLGRLSWSPVSYVNLAGYVVYMAGTDLDSFGAPVWTEIGRTRDVFFDVPSVDASALFFGVASYSGSGAVSPVTALNSILDQDTAPVNPGDPPTEPVVIANPLVRPWLDANGDLVFQPDGRILDSAYVVVDGNNVLISDVAAGNIVPTLNFVGEFAEAPDEVDLGADWKQNALYRNTGDGNLYVLTGTPLGWVLYLEGGNAWTSTVESSNGTVFRVGGVDTTDLSLRLFKNGAEVTDATPAGWFHWRRNSSDSAGDSAFLASYGGGGYKTVTVTAAGTPPMATFFCDIISP